MTFAPKKDKPVAPAQFAFSPLFAHQRPHVSPVEVAKALGISDQQVRNLLESGRFAATPIGVGDAASAKYVHKRLLRFTVEAWWLEEWFKTHGEEYPLPNSPEITMWRNKLKTRALGAPAIKP